MNEEIVCGNVENNIFFFTCWCIINDKKFIFFHFFKISRRKQMVYTWKKGNTERERTKWKALSLQQKILSKIHAVGTGTFCSSMFPSAISTLNSLLFQFHDWFSNGVCNLLGGIFTGNLLSSACGLYLIESIWFNLQSGDNSSMAKNILESWNHWFCYF